MPSRTRRHTSALIVSTVAVTVLLSGCSAATPAAPRMNELGHVHGLDATHGRIFAATHQGVWAIDAAKLGDGFATETTARVGISSQDTMGFTVARSGVMFASGHPDPGNNPQQLPANLGLVQSLDAAQTWKTVSLSGHTDFHDLVTATTSDARVRIYGYDAGQQRVRISDDGGHTWHDGATLSLRKLAVNPNAPDTLLATTQAGVQISRDAGMTFSALPGGPLLYLVAPVDAAAGAFIGVDVNKKIWATTDDGSTWARKGTFDTLPESLATVQGASRLWILGAHANGIVATADHGASWVTLIEGTP